MCHLYAPSIFIYISYYKTLLNLAVYILLLNVAPLPTINMQPLAVKLVEPLPEVASRRLSLPNLSLSLRNISGKLADFENEYHFKL